MATPPACPNCRLPNALEPHCANGHCGLYACDVCRSLVNPGLGRYVTRDGRLVHYQTPAP